MKVLGGGESSTDEVGTRGWLYYSSFVPNNVISMTYFIQQQNSGDCDFYVKAGSIPSKSYYDAKDTTIETSFSVTLPVYSSTTYYAGLYGYRDCSFVISLSFTSGSSFSLSFLPFLFISFFPSSPFPSLLFSSLPFFFQFRLSISMIKIVDYFYYYYYYY